MAKKSNNSLTYGLIMLIYGVIFLLSKIRFLEKIPHGQKLLSIGSFFLIVGLVFLFTKKEKTFGIVFTIIGVIINADFFFGWINNYSQFIVPAIMIIVGVVLVLVSQRK